MSSRQTLIEAAREAGWSSDRALEVACKYIDSQCADEAFAEHVRREQEDEEDAIAEDVMNEPEERHSVNCYFCGKLVDERDCIPADDMNGNDGGSQCPKCSAAMLDVINDITEFVRENPPPSGVARSSVEAVVREQVKATLSKRFQKAVDAVTREILKEVRPE